ncbi:acyl carrier protein [Streptomonospora nanhaiensis]|uniref:Acyl carrier protein n=1 Tax=Streptomonospora nanhaiensis TaxID=1323731 RepID=A0ABY6YTZ6_9ACTN|nr:acyl carrier protein [Streptomonospora nanhaiensis]WAE75576.1 acyl carrier protein [Streptomonospora nanhaiensis]
MAKESVVTETMVLEIIREAVDGEGGYPGREELLQDVGVDSIAGYEIRLLIRERCGAQVSEEEFDGLRSVGDLLDLLRCRGGAPAGRGTALDA